MCATGVQIAYVDRRVDRILERDRVTMTDLLRSRIQEMHPSAFLFRRTALIDGIGLVDEEIPGSYGEDYELMLRAARRTPIVNVPIVGVVALWHRQSYFTARWKTIATALEWLLERYPEFQTDPAGSGADHRPDRVRQGGQRIARFGGPLGRPDDPSATRAKRAPTCRSPWPAGSCQPTRSCAGCTTAVAESRRTRYGLPLQKLFQTAFVAASRIR